MSNKNEFLSQYGSEDHAVEAVKSSDVELQYFGSMNYLLPKEHMDTLLKDDDAWHGHIGLSLNPSTPTEIVNKLSSHQDGEVQRNALIHRNVSKSTVQAALRNPRVWSDAHEKIVKSSPHVTKEDLNYVVDSKTKHFGTLIKDAAFDRLQNFK